MLATLSVTPTPLSGHTRSTLITRASSLLRAGPPARPHRYSTPHSFCCSTRSLSPPVTFPGHRQQYQHTPSHVPCSSCRSGSRRLHTGHHLASKRVSARFIPKIYTDLGSDVVSSISMLHQRFALTRLPDPCLTAFTPPFPQSLPHSPHRSSAYAALRRLDISPRRATPKGHKTFIYYTALLHDDRPTLRPPIHIRGTHAGTGSPGRVIPLTLMNSAGLCVALARRARWRWVSGSSAAHNP